jgi:aminoglycoside phosphotransferase (APT) family kinase protein
MGALHVGAVLGELVARGSRSSVFAWGRGAVAKVPDPTTPDSWIHAEAVYTAAVRDAGAPAPRLLGIERVNGRAVSIYERVHGPSMWQFVVDRPDRAEHYGRVLGQLHSALFELVPPIVLPCQQDRLTSKIRRAAEQVDPVLLDALRLFPHAAGPSRLCHGDLHPGNVILSPEGPMIVDWFDASRGNPVADVARSSLLLLADGPDAPLHLPGADRETLARLAESYLACVAENLQLAPDDLARWQAVETAARLAEGVDCPALLSVWFRLDRRRHLAAVPAPVDVLRNHGRVAQAIGI